MEFFWQICWTKRFVSNQTKF